MSLFGLFERRGSLENPEVPLTDLSLLSWMTGPVTDSGVPINEMTAMRMAAVYRATSLVSGLCGALPIKVYKRGTKDPGKSELLDEPHPDMTRLELWRLTGVHRCLWGNAYLQKIYTKGTNRIAYLEPITPSRVTVTRARPIPANPSGKIFKVTDDHGVVQPMTPNEILHIPGLGYDGRVGFSPIKMAAQAIGVSLAAEAYGAKLFGSGNLLSGYLTAEGRIEQEDAEKLQARWAEKTAGLDRAHKIAVLDSGLKFQSLTMPNDDAELLASRDFQVTELCRFYGVPPYLMFQTEKTTSWGQGLEQQARGFVQFDLNTAWTAPLEQRITKELLKKSLEARYDMNDLMRGDSIARAQYYAVLREAGVLSADDIRYAEDMAPLPNGQGQTYIQPSIQAPMGSDPVLGGFSLGRDPEK